MTDWQEIIKEYGPAVWWTAYRLLGNGADAADCFQETFVSLIDIARRQRVANFAALVKRVATNRAIDMLRQRARNSRINTAQFDLDILPVSHMKPMEQLEHRELASRLRQGLAQLPGQQAEVFSLRVLSGLSYRQIAKQLGIKTSAAGVLLHRARAKLHHLLEQSPQEQKGVIS